MDPNAALRDLIDAVLEGDWASAYESVSSLEEWDAKGGFKPRDPREAEITVEELQDAIGGDPWRPDNV